VISKHNSSIIDGMDVQRRLKLNCAYSANSAMGAAMMMPRSRKYFHHDVSEENRENMRECRCCERAWGDPSSCRFSPAIL